MILDVYLMLVLGGILLFEFTRQLVRSDTEECAAWLLHPPIMMPILIEAKQMNIMKYRVFLTLLSMQSFYRWITVLVIGQERIQ